MRFIARAAALAVYCVALASPALAQMPDPARVAAQKAAMDKLAFLDGEWRGPSKMLVGKDTWRTMTQAERVGPMLDGSVRVIEGRGYEADGKLNFNAFAVISFDPDTKAYTMRSWQGGRVGDFPIEVIENGFKWDLEAGPSVKINYVATVKDGVWTEIGARSTNGGPAVKFYEFSVTRLRDTSWPASGFVGPAD